MNVFGYIVENPVLIELSANDRTAINHTLLHWFEATNKKQVAGLDVKIEDFKKKITRLSRSIVLKYDYTKGGVVESEAPGEDGQTLLLIKSGSAWFDGWNHVEVRLLAVIQDVP